MTSPPVPHEGTQDALPSLSGSLVTALSLTKEGDALSGRNLPGTAGLDAFARSLMSCRLSDISRRTFGDVVRTIGRVGGVAREHCALPVDGAALRYDAEIWRQESGAVGVLLVDVTDQARDSGSVHALSLELAHRTKNVLAVVLSLATQTGRRMPDYQSFKDRFQVHVEALSGAHDLIAASGWLGVPLVEIVGASVVGTDEAPVAVTVAPEAGVAVLRPNAVQNLFIILRELQTAGSERSEATCAVAVGEGGALDLVWECTDGGDEGLWTDMLCQHAPVALDGTGALDRVGGGFRYRLRIGPGQRV